MAECYHESNETIVSTSSEGTVYTTKCSRCGEILVVRTEFNERNR